MDVKQIVGEINNSTYGFDCSTRPTTLNHWVGNMTVELERLDEVKANGLHPRPCRPEISALLPQRPAAGIYFWANGQQPETHKMTSERRISVSVSDLDTDKLFAFPAQAADLADQLVQARAYGHEVAGGEDVWVQALAQIKPVPYVEYTGQFLAEWIYTGDIAPGLIK